MKKKNEVEEMNLYVFSVVNYIENKNILASLL